MHRNNGLCLCGYLLFKVRRVHIKGLIDLTEDRYGADIKNRLPGGDKGKPLGDHLVSCADTKGSESDL